MKLIDQCLIFRLMLPPDSPNVCCLIKLFQRRKNAQHTFGVGGQISFRDVGAKSGGGPKFNASER